MTATLATPAGIVQGVSSVRGATGRLALGLLWIQGVYYLVLGVWSMVSVEAVHRVLIRGPEHAAIDHEAGRWLILAVGVLLTAISFALLTAAMRNRRTIEITCLAVGIALGLTIIDVVYVSREAISGVVLVDATVEMLLLLGWIVSAVLSWTLRQIKRPTDWRIWEWVSRKVTTR